MQLGNQTRYLDVPRYETTGDGATKNFTLSWQPGFPGALLVYVGGVPQPVTAYSVSGYTLQLSEAPASGARLIVVGFGIRGILQDPAAGSVTSQKLDQSGLVLPSNATMQETPAQFDNDLSLATTAFVQRALGNCSGVVTCFNGGSLSLAAADSGKTVNISGAGASTITLPDGATLPIGATFEFFQSNASATTIQRFGADVIYVNSGTVTGFTIYSGDSLKLIWIGAWIAVSGTAQAQHSTGRFASSFATSGYQKLPSGLIIQWGVAGVAGGATASVTFPTAFVNTCLQIVACHDNAAASALNGYFYGATIVGLSGFTVGAKISTGGTSVVGVRWLAIGY